MRTARVISAVGCALAAAIPGAPTAHAWPQPSQLANYPLVDVADYTQGADVRFRTGQGVFCNLREATMVCAMDDGNLPGYPPAPAGRITFFQTSIAIGFDTAVKQTDGPVQQQGTVDLHQVHDSAKPLPARHRIRVDYPAVKSSNGGTYTPRSFVCWVDGDDRAGCFFIINDWSSERSDIRNHSTLLPRGGPFEVR